MDTGSIVGITLVVVACVGIFVGYQLFSRISLARWKKSGQEDQAAVRAADQNRRPSTTVLCRISSRRTQFIVNVHFGAVGELGSTLRRLVLEWSGLGREGMEENVKLAAAVAVSAARRTGKAVDVGGFLDAWR
jgi:hypothetical protein